MAAVKINTNIYQKFYHNTCHKKKNLNKTKQKKKSYNTIPHEFLFFIVLNNDNCI